MAETEVEISFDYDGQNFTLPFQDGHLVGCQWLPHSGPLTFVLIFVHGLGAFASINRAYFEQILADGGAVIATDHYGHGRSPGSRGLTSSELLAEEIELIIKRANILFPEIPLFMYGHSMGGVAALAFVMANHRMAKKLEGLIIECPWLNDTDAMSSSIPLNLLGKFGRFLFPTTAFDAGGGWGDTHYSKQFRETYEKSSLPHDYITPILYASVFEFRKITCQFDLWPNHLSLLFMQGGKDASVGVKKNLEWAEELRNRHPDKVRLVYHRDGEHAILRNECGPTVLRELIDFVNTCLARPTI
jgi:alpha-beta hydrolase superfamily lysophospholipase